MPLGRRGLGGALKHSHSYTDRLLMHFTVANDTIEAMTKPVVAAINRYCSPWSGGRDGM